MVIKKINFSLILDSSVNYKSLITVFVSSPNSITPSFKLKISGLKENQYIGVGFHNYGSNIAHGLGNGIHNIPSWTNNTLFTNNIYINDNTSPRQHRIYDNVTIELLPEYPDALVFDGVDDYIDMDNVVVANNNKFKTVFMLCNYFKDHAYLYDGRSRCAMYINGNHIAYQENFLGKSYINGTLNTKVTCSELMNKKHLAISYNNTDGQIYNASIGSHSNKTNLFMNMALYKFLGFKEALTEEQIQTVIKKYNLLDGVDEIEVS